MRLLTAEQVAQEFGIPSARTVRTMRGRGLPFVKLGKACLFDGDDVAAFIAAQKESACPAQIQDRASHGSTVGNRSTSRGTNKVASGSRQLDIAIDNLLKKPSRNTSEQATEDRTGQVIRRDFGSPTC